jgi:hypothetical protein
MDDVLRIGRDRTAGRARFAAWICLLLALGQCLFVPETAIAAEAVASKPCDHANGKCEPRPQDQIWLISTRHLGCPSSSESDSPDFGVWRYDGKDGWEKTNIDGFFAAQNPQTRVMVNIHGARVDWSEANRRGFLVHRRVTCEAPQDEAITFVIWSWPASKAGRPIRDLRAMAMRSDTDGYYLAWMLSRLDPNTPINMMGYSFGCRAITGAMHLLNGGSLIGHTLPTDAKPKRKPPTVVLWTPALHDYWLEPGQHNGRAIENFDRMLIVHNTCDRALQHYHWITACGRPRGLGYLGLPNRSVLGEAAERIEEWDGCCVLGSEHSFYSHLNSETIMQKTRAYFFPASTP